MRKRLSSILVLVVLTGLALLAASGFEPRTDVCLYGFDVSEDGSVLTVRTTLMTSTGYTRAMAYETVEGTVRCSFLRTFGGMNSRIGARSEFTIGLDGSETQVRFDRGDGASQAVLEKDGATGTWHVPEHGK